MQYRRLRHAGKKVLTKVQNFFFYIFIYLFKSNEIPLRYLRFPPFVMTGFSEKEAFDLYMSLQN